MRIEIDYSLTVDEVHEFQRAFPKIVKALPRVNKVRISGSMWGWIIILAAAIMMSMLLENVREPAPVPAAPVSDHPLRNMIWDILPYALVFVVIWVYFLRTQYSKAAAKKTIENDPMLAERQHITFADEGLNMQGPTTSTFSVWTHYIHFAETENLFVLLITRQTAQIFPKRAFASQAEQDEFRGFAQAHVGNTPIGFPVQPAKNPETTITPGT